MNIRDRIKEFKEIDSSEIEANPKNWRMHNESQKSIMKGLLDEIGFAAATMVRELPSGKYELIDGHMRAEIAEGEKIPALVLDVTEDEADRLLLVFDPLKQMAERDAVALESLLQEVVTDNQDIAKLFEIESKKIAPKETPEEDELDDSEESLEGVRVVQLFLDDSNIEPFQVACSKLSEHYKTQNISDTVLKAMQNAVNQV